MSGRVLCRFFMLIYLNFHEGFHFFLQAEIEINDENFEIAHEFN